MSALSGIGPESLADLRPATRRAVDGSRSGFGADFERAYVLNRLLSQRTLIRLASAFTATLALARSIEQLVAGAFWHPAQPAVLALVLAASLLLAALPWTRTFKRFYLPTARILVPGRNVLAAVFATGAAAQGHAEMLILLPLMILGPYFFLGLSWHAALVSALASLGAFFFGAEHFGLALPITLRVGILLILGVITGAIAARYLDRLARRNFLESHRMSTLAEHDALTGLKNRRVFDDRLHKLWRRAVESKDRLAILLIDIDYFKDFNDRHGHQAGDRALREVAQTLQDFALRPRDVLARYGGEEFAAIFPELDPREVELIAEGMRRAVNEASVDGRQADGTAPVTISIGVAIVEPTHERQPRGAVQLADQALYEAKLRGRNRVVLMDQSAHRMLETGVFAKAGFSRDR
jgi:diguanylate cyclase (GGDEF)-like protein